MAWNYCNNFPFVVSVDKTDDNLTDQHSVAQFEPSSPCLDHWGCPALFGIFCRHVVPVEEHRDLLPADGEEGNRIVRLFGSVLCCGVGCEVRCGELEDTNFSGSRIRTSG